jgi:hypothetical protein
VTLKQRLSQDVKCLYDQVDDPLAAEMDRSIRALTRAEAVENGQSVVARGEARKAA